MDENKNNFYDENNEPISVVENQSEEQDNLELELEFAIIESYKHYIKIDKDGFVVDGYSNAFKSPLEEDILVGEGGRHFQLMGEINPMLTNENGKYLYKYVDGEVVDTTEEERAKSNDELIKELKMAENKLCSENISKGFDVELRGKKKHFDCELHNQINIDNLYQTALLVENGFKLPEGVALEYNTSDDECLEDLSFDEISAIWTNKNTHLYIHRKQCELNKKAIK